ncbi:universal stress protein [Rhodococcus sp. SMB37]|uniref:universal stress protein n=1 Tax=Rhodococcus sp. SMB37 TaxID=2512213 RepID=UPI0006CF2963|nr:universal stress protein [Rhodococcus sp. SMB37]
MKPHGAVPQDHNHITVGVDGSSASDHAVRWAAATAAGRRLTLHIVHAVDFGPTGWTDMPFFRPAEVFEWAEEKARVVLSDAEKIARSTAPDLEITTATSMTGGSAWLVELSLRARILVLGASGHGRLGEAVLGSTPSAVTSHAGCPVVVVRGTEPVATPDVRPVVVGADGSPLSEAAVACAFEEASWRGVGLVAVHVWSDMKVGTFESLPPSLDPQSLEENENAILAEQLAGYRERYPDVTVDRKLYLDGPRSRLQEWSEQAQLLVVGSRGRGGFTGLLLGSTSNALLRQAQCPVMVVRPHQS